MEKHQKRQRAVLKNFENAIDKRNEPYNSILRILFLAPQFNNIFKLIKIMELKELIVKRYTISSKKRDRERYHLLQKFKKELQKNENIKLDQEIKPQKNLLKSNSSDHQRFESYIGRLEKKGFIERPERGYCCLSNKYLFKPFKNWCNNIISNCPINHSAMHNNSILFLPNISIDEFNDDEILELRSLLADTVESHQKIIFFLDRVGFKKANNIWEKFILNIDISNITKFYYWIKIVQYHYTKNLLKILFYLRKMSDDKRNITDEKVRESILGLDTMNKLRYGSFQKWEEYIKKYNVDEWMDNLNNVMDMAFVKYIKKSFPSEDIKNIEQRFERERKKYDDDFDNIKRKTLIITAEIEYSIMTIFPDFLKYPSLEKLGASHNKALVIEEAIGYLQNRHPFNEKAFLALSRLIRNKTPENKRFEKIIKDTLDNKLDFNEIFDDIEEIKVKREIEKQKDYPSFFEKEDFFNDFEKQLKGLDIANKIDLYEGLRFLANTFKLPDLKQ